MGDDREILRDVWEGKIPVEFHLAEDEALTGLPDPVYLMVSRQTYFPLVTDKVQKSLSQHIDKDSVEELWLEADGQPLKWHIPVGVLFDLYGDPVDLPWKLTVHFKDFPEEELLHCTCKEAVESHFISVVKEADSLKHRGQVINGMQKRDHKQLWSGLVNEKFDQFWPINKRLMECTGEDMFKYIPFRIYLPDHSHFQKLFRPVTEEGIENTLQNLMDFLSKDIQRDFPGDHRYVMQGIEPPLETPLLWLSEHLSYPDNFLHICVLPKEIKSEW